VYSIAGFFSFGLFIIAGGGGMVFWIIGK